MSQPAQACVSRLEEIVGGEHVLTATVDLAARQIDGMIPSAVVRPADAAQIAEIIRFAVADRLALVPCGRCTKLGIGSPPARYDIALDLTRMNQVLAYDPRDLTLGVEPGVPVDDLLRVLGDQRQLLPLAVPFSERATIGGAVAANSSSPLRHAYGGVRDFCLGMEFVTGDGKIAKSGGRVVKNVTGYDLHKLLIGSLGTLAVITRVNFRTFPLHAAHGTFVASFSGAEAAFKFCRAIAQSVLTPQIVEVVDPEASRLVFSSELPALTANRLWSVVVAASGQPSVVDRHAHDLGRLAGTANAAEFARFGDTEPSSILARLREFPRLVREAAPSAAIFRVGVLPTAIVPLLARFAELASRNFLRLSTVTRACGIVYAAFLPDEGDAMPAQGLSKTCAEAFRASAETGSVAMLEWCPVEVKRAIGDLWGPPRPDFALMKRIKNSFDPQGVLSPGRFAGGI